MLQVTSSNGLPYTIHLNFPSYPPLAAKIPSPPAPEVPAEQLPDSPLTTTTDLPSLVEDQPMPLKDVSDTNKADRDQAAATAQTQKRQRVCHEARMMERMYCPCPGFMYGSLSGDRNFLVSADHPAHTR